MAKQDISPIDFDFHSFFLGGFECSTHRLRSGERLDLIASTRHDALAYPDYLRLRDVGIRTARDGARWHLIEPTPGRYAFSSLVPQLRAARTAGTQVIWDLCHYGYPDDLDPFSAAFVERLARFAGAATRVLREETEGTLFVSPINEISFWAWAAGDAGYLNPFVHGRAGELKAQLARACIAAVEAVWSVDPAARIVHADPIIHIVPVPERPEDAAAAEEQRQYQYEGWDMIAGRQKPHLGGDPRYLDILGVNYYVHNQWFHHPPAGHPRYLKAGDPLYRPLSEMLREVYERYRRPLFIAETGIENQARPSWLRYICGEVSDALALGLPIAGICLYPIVDHPGWDRGLHRHNGLWGYADDAGERPIYQPLAEELRRQQARFAVLRGVSEEKEPVDAHDFEGQADLLIEEEPSAPAANH
jgi:beta-glucosidase/6-phospho-beta-glucosidase/beta-galactosidase